MTTTNMMTTTATMMKLMTLFLSLNCRFHLQLLHQSHQSLCSSAAEAMDGAQRVLSQNTRRQANPTRPDPHKNPNAFKTMRAESDKRSLGKDKLKGRRSSRREQWWVTMFEWMVQVIAIQNTVSESGLDFDSRENV